MNTEADTTVAAETTEAPKREKKNKQKGDKSQNEPKRVY